MIVVVSLVVKFCKVGPQIFFTPVPPPSNEVPLSIALVLNIFVKARFASRPPWVVDIL